MTTHPTLTSSISSPRFTPAPISVAMCTFNGERYLREQLQTIAEQSRLPLELVVTDDRSTDSTLALLESFASTAPFPVRIFQNERQLGSSRNFDRAIRLCDGDYIALADQDDRWRVNKLQNLGAVLDGHPEASMVFSDAILIDQTSQPTGGTLWEALRFPPPVQQRFTQDAAAVLLERPVVTGATMLFRRNLLTRFAAIPPEWVHDGWITWMSVLWAAVLYLDEPLTEYRIHASQQLGVGEESWAGRLASIQHRQRSLYAQAARELRLLQQYGDSTPGAAGLSPQLPGRIADAAHFYEQRAQAPAGRWARLGFLWGHRSRYQALSRYRWRALLRDLFME